MKNQAVTSEKKPKSSDAPPVAFLRDEKQLAERLREAMGEQSGSAFAKRCGISEGAIRKYLLGASPSTENLIAMADAANVSIEWLAAGRGPKQRGSVAQPAPEPAPALDEQLLSRSIGAVEAGLHAVSRSLPPEKHAQLIFAAYNLLGKLEVSDKAADQAISKARTQVIEFIKLAA